jgi:DNA-binding protein H-NS
MHFGHHVWLGRRLTLPFALCFLAVTTVAQEQERKLVDRLLEPNTKLGNSEQNKQFTGAETVTAKSASSRSFYVSNTKLIKTFAGTHELTTQSYQSRQFASQPANLPPPQKPRTFATADARGVKPAPESSAAYKSRQFAGSRPFLDQGKSQKALHQQDHPLSIDDVRELLNKNK